MTFKRAVGKLHLVLGLASGLVVFIVALTGALLVFEHEIKALLAVPPAPHRLAPSQPGVPLLKPTEIGKILEKLVPGGAVISGVNYRRGRSSYCWGWLEGETHADFAIFVDPHTGTVLKTEGLPIGQTNSQEGRDHAPGDDLFHFLIEGHRHLWLPGSIGAPIVHYSTMIFLVLIVTGLVLWWPKGKAARKARTTFQWKPTTKWKRKNYDLHNILGFYASAVAALIAITGLAMAVDWFAKGWHTVLSGGIPRPPHNGVLTKIDPAAQPPPGGHPVDQLWQKYYAENPGYTGWIELYFPEDNDGELTFRWDADPGRRAAENFRFNPATLQDLALTDSFADKVVAKNYAIHVGEIWGLPTKILAFGASLTAASLPVTGFLIWRGRRRKPAIP